jgi:hypothetical protein
MQYTDEEENQTPLFKIYILILSTFLTNVAILGDSGRSSVVESRSFGVALIRFLGPLRMSARFRTLLVADSHARDSIFSRESDFTLLGRRLHATKASKAEFSNSGGPARNTANSSPSTALSRPRSSWATLSEMRPRGPSHDRDGSER